MRWRKHWDNYGVVEVISTVVSIFMVLTVISAVMLWGVPYMEELKAKAVYENINSKLNAASNSIDAIIHETAGSSRTYTFAVEQGLVSTNNVGDRFVVSYSLEEGYDFAVTGLEGNDKNFNVIFSADSIKPQLGNFEAVVYRFPDDPIIKFRPCDDISLVDLAGNTCSYLKFDITPIYELENQMQIVSVKLRLTPSHQQNIFNGEPTNVCVSHVDNQFWDESWSASRLSTSSVSQHKEDVVFFSYPNYVESSNVLDVFLADYESHNSFCSLCINAPSSMLVQPAFTIDHTLLHIGRGTFDPFSFYSHETDLFAPELIINYIELPSCSSVDFSDSDSDSKDIDDQSKIEIDSDVETTSGLPVRTDGSKVKIFHAGEGIYGPSGYPIKTSITPKKKIVGDISYDFTGESGSYTAFFRRLSSKTQKKPVAMLKENYALTFTPGDYLYCQSDDDQQSLVAKMPSMAQVDGNKLTYVGQYGPGFDLAYTYMGNVLKEELVITNKTLMLDLLPDCADLVLLHHIEAYHIDTGESMGLRYGEDKVSLKSYGCFKDVTVTSSEPFYFTDEDDNIVFCLPEIYAWDSDRFHSKILLNKTLHMTRFGTLLVEICVSRMWLSDENTLYPVYIDPTLTTSSISSDGYIRGRGIEYAAVQQMNEGSYLRDGREGSTIGQGTSYDYQEGTDIYNIYRTFLFFDTQSIPDEAVIESARLSLWRYGLDPQEDFQIVIQHSSGGYPDLEDDGLELGDYYWENYDGDGGSIDTDDLALGGYNDIFLTDEGEGWIDKAGITKLCLRSYYDISKSAPTFLNEMVTIYASEYSGREPILTVEYSNSPPYEPESHTPTGTNVPLVTSLTWGEAEDPDGDDVVYDVYFKEGDSIFGDGDIILNNQPDTSISSEDLLGFIGGAELDKLTRYYWKLVARDNGNPSAESEWIWSFKTRGQIYFEFLGTLPSGDINYADVTFSWEVYGLPDGAYVTYRYQLDGYISRWSSWSTDTSRTYFNLPDGTYTFKLESTVHDTGFPVVITPDPVGFNVIMGTYLDESDPETIDPSLNDDIYQFESSSNGALAGTIRIDLIDDAIAGTDKIFGRIYLFDLGLVKHSYSSVIGECTTVLENNGILSIKSGKESVSKAPGVFSEDDLLALRIVQMRNIEHYSTGGSGKLRFTSTLLDNSVREILTDVHDVKLQVFGPYEDVWLDYFKKTCGFEELSDDPANGHTLVAPLEGAADTIVNPDEWVAAPAAGNLGGLYAFDDSTPPRPYIFQDTGDSDKMWEYDSGDVIVNVDLDGDGQDLAEPDPHADPKQKGGLYAFDGSDPYIFQDTGDSDKMWEYDSDDVHIYVGYPSVSGTPSTTDGDFGGLYALDNQDTLLPYTFKDTNGDWKYLAQLTITQSFCKIGFRI